MMVKMVTSVLAVVVTTSAVAALNLNRICEVNLEDGKIVRVSGGNGKEVTIDVREPELAVDAFRRGASRVVSKNRLSTSELYARLEELYVAKPVRLMHTNTVWRLAEEFLFTNRLDRSIWKQFAHHPWQEHRPETIITNEDLAYVGGGVLHLVGMLNPNVDKLYSYPCRCGRIKTEGTLNMHYGKVEIDVKMEDQNGSLVALWMMPQMRVGKWPLCGEIDIIERLNNEDAVWQTEHNYRADALFIDQNPRNHAHVAVKTREWNTYGLEWYPDELVWTVNGKPTFWYPKTSERKEDWPWDNPQYLRMEMIMENTKWAGPFDPATLPCEARIRSVRFYVGEIGGKPFGRVWRLNDSKSK